MAKPTSACAAERVCHASRVPCVICRTDCLQTQALNQGVLADSSATTGFCHALRAQGWVFYETLKGHSVKPTSTPKTKTPAVKVPALKQQQVDFTAEGAPPPGKVGTDVPATPTPPAGAPKAKPADLPPAGNS
jgi:hypothetical protein